MDNETKTMFEKILQKLDGMDKRFDGMDQRFDGIDKRLDGIDQRFDGIDKRFDGIDIRLDGIDKKQDEMYVMQRALEENTKVTRAEQDKMIYILADIQGKVTKLTDEVEKHESFISQIRAIK